MEKHTAHCKLHIVKALVEAGRVTATATATAGARAVGIDTLQGMCDVVLTLTSQDFYKSMTTHANHRVWQDVYHAETADGVALYVKLTVIDDLVIVSFKEL
ncbi:type II toxin-antitoxin system MqsR family toxin [Massilia sp. YIM B02763]|uniref:type II toxin-antitoxin system MqsR family toxin n=1 Tax=Massilia sp. YIM B02763 TaxID=3050130 RepID=UPI0025B6D80A|nr:type II toxin-antitoxin system MqsR family toxin [Massilia sp. YIM B02763]MDN4056355.1 type II toxin-antitoxin system MqsR family toxin [Massilia sp. YIM B02763]